MIEEADNSGVGDRVRSLRQRCHLSIRQLAERAGVAPSYITGVETGRTSPTIASLRKLLVALGSDLATFFAEDAAPPEGHVFRREGMRTVVDATRCYALVLPHRSDVRIAMLDEEIAPGESPEFETLGSDLAGYVLHGELVLEAGDDPPQTLRPGDAFYIPAERPVRGRCATQEPVRLITVEAPLQLPRSDSTEEA